MGRGWFFAAMIVSLVALSGCSSSAPPGDPPGPPATVVESVTEVEPAPAPAPAPEPPKPPLPAWVTPVTDENFTQLVAAHRPNELGKVLILEYHHFGDEEERWTRTYANFRKDLETLYAKGYRLVSLQDYLTGELKLPAGTSPVILTFDDSPKNQFPGLLKDGQWEPDPRSPVAIILQFGREHPDFGVGGTFFVKFTEVPFEEEASWQAKLQFLVAHGFEVGNHSYTHDNLSQLDEAGVQRSLAMNVKRVQEALPDYDGFALALPFGILPDDPALAVAGQHEGTRYQHRAVLLAADSPNPSPYDRRLEVYSLQRTQAIESEFDRWLPFLERSRYISDGDPETIVIPADLAEHLDPAKVGAKRVRLYDE